MMRRHMVAKGPGLEQGRARKLARELGGIAVGVRPSPRRPGEWLLGGWASRRGEVWIVISLDQQTVLADGEEKS